MKIKQLSETTINRIAAGEVVERPASVVKELIENSIDAGATSIDIIIERGGKNLIIVSDNGQGMSKEDLLLSVERHTTSKLNENDIMNILNFGFRGEALPSICSISRVRIDSHDEFKNISYNLTIEGGVKNDIIPSNHPKGTKIEVRDLFFATPARLKFLKNDKLEQNYIQDIVRKIAIVHPEISFRLITDGKEILNVHKENLENQYLNRIRAIYGEDFANNNMYVEGSAETNSIFGYVSLPTYNKSSASEQLFYVNKRPIKDKLLNIALKIAYMGLISHERYPTGCLFINMDPRDVDVNVHPAKSEVRFRDPSFIKEFISTLVKKELKNNSRQVSNHIAIINKFEPEQISETKAAPPSNFNPSSYISPLKAEERIYPNTTRLQEPSSPTFKASSFISELAPFTKEFKPSQVSSSFALGAACAQVDDTYIISKTEDSIILVDQHAAHERITLQKLKQELSELKTQRLLMPEIIDLPLGNDDFILNKEYLNKLGLIFEIMGGNNIIVREVPLMFKGVNIKQLILDLEEGFKNLGTDILSEKIEHIFASFACHNSIRAGKKMSIEEMNYLLRQIESTDYSAQCNHGRPTYIKLKLKDIEKLFERG